MTEGAAPLMVGAELTVGVGGLRRRIGVGALDHGVSTITNVLITLAAARALSLTDFGRFGAAYIAATTLVGVVRALVGEPSLVSSANREGVRAALGGALAVSLALAVLVLAALLATDRSSHALVAALAMGLPGLALTEIARYLSFAAGNATLALRIDLLWLGVVVVGIAAAAACDCSTGAVLFAVWGFGATIAAARACWALTHQVPAPTLGWIRDRWSLGSVYLLSFLATAGAVQFSGLALVAVVGADAVGTLRGSQLLLGFLNPIYAALLTVLVPENALRRERPDPPARELVFVSLVTPVLAGIAVSLALVLPRGLGELLLGDSWGSARGVLVPAGLAVGIYGLSNGANLALRSAKAARASLRVQVLLLPTQFVMPIAAALAWGINGFMWASVASAALSAAGWWLQYEHLKRRSAVGSGEATATGPGRGGRVR